MTTPEVTAGQIERWLLESSPGGLASCRAKGPVLEGINSRVFFAECNGFSSPLLVKLCLKPRTCEADPDAAQRQYDALLRVWHQMGEAEFSVPRPYILRSDIGLLATEWVEGRSMTALVFSWRSGGAYAQQLVAQAGGWLRHFHACHPLAPGRIDVEAKLRFVDQMGASHAVRDPAFAAALARLRDWAKAAASVKLEQSWVHGDFKTDNLIVSGARTVGIDIHLRHEGPTIHDLAQFLNELEMRLLHPSGWRLAGMLPALRDAFLGSYRYAGVDSIALPLAWLQLFMIVGRWHEAHARIGTALRFRFRSLCYRRIALRLTRLIAKRFA